jgi:cytochrome c biogenesis protein CcmG/thiol:disulfide interchange protein DsbE
MRLRAGSRVALFAALILVAGVRPGSADSLLNKKAPEFARQAFNGRKLDLAAYRGKVVLLNFWATWCAPCQEEMPVFATWQRQYGAQGLQVVGISMDDAAAPARQLAERLKLDYPVAMGDAPLGELYGGVDGLPFTLLIDKSGTVRAQFLGETDLKSMETRLKALLRQR